MVAAAAVAAAELDSSSSEAAASTAAAVKPTFLVSFTLASALRDTVLIRTWRLYRLSWERWL